MASADVNEPLSIPQASTILVKKLQNPLTSNLLQNDSTFSNVQREQSRGQKGDTSRYKFLDAVTFFLPTQAQQGQVFAATIALGDITVFTVAANHESHFHRNESHGTEAFITDLWEGLRKHTQAPADKVIVALLFRHHYAVMKFRFEKRRDAVLRLFGVLNEESLPLVRQGVVNLARKVYDVSEEFFSHPEFHASRAWLYYSALFKLDEQLQDLPSTAIWLTEYEDRIGQQAPVESKKLRIDLLRYLEKLVSPSRHAYQIISHRKAHAFLVKPPLRIELIHSNEHRPRVSLPTKDTVSAWLKALYVCPPEVEDETGEVEEDVINSACAAMMRDAGPTGPRSQLQHCECLLLAHHHLGITTAVRGYVSPYPYMSCSKLACLFCALYFEAYKDFIRRERRSDLVDFGYRACHGEVVQAYVPVQTQEALLDQHIGGYLLERIEKLLTLQMQRDALQHRFVGRKVAQSTAAASDDEDSEDSARRRMSAIDSAEEQTLKSETSAA